MLSVLVANPKGGCGKSTITTNLAAAFANGGLKTAIADVDPACKQAIAEQESTKDDTLQQIVTASRTVKASRAQLIMYCTAAIILIAAIPIYFWLNDLIQVIGCVVASAVVGLIGWKVVGND